MIASISEAAADEQYSTKSMAKNVIKLNCFTPDAYRNMVKHCKGKGIFFHIPAEGRESLQSGPQIHSPLH
jgi:hypothetical protein